MVSTAVTASGAVLCAHVRKLLLNRGQLLVRAVLQVHQVGPGRLDGAQQLVEFEVDGLGIAMLRRLTGRVKKVASAPYWTTEVPCSATRR